jgi:D-threo-aldose 1-dehydrogenase
MATPRAPRADGWAPGERRRLGRTGVEVSVLGLGTAPLGGLYDEVSEDAAVATVQAALDLGIRYFDTAPLYGHGLSEQRLGLGLANHGTTGGDVVVSTKVGRLLRADVPADPDDIFRGTPPVNPAFDFSADGVARSLEESLERLGRDSVDIVLVHDPDDFGDQVVRETLPALARWRDEGVVRAIGAGMNQGAMLTRFVDEADVDCVLLAGRYTLLDQSALDDLLPRCVERGVAVIAGGVFNSGLLANPEPGAPYDYVAAPDDLVLRARRMARVCAEHGVPLKAAALQFPLRHPAVACVLTGTRSHAELAENAALMRRPIPAELWGALGV